MDRYAIVAKITFISEGEDMEDALRKGLAQLPDKTGVLEASVFPAQVKQTGKGEMPREAKAELEKTQALKHHDWLWHRLHIGYRQCQKCGLVLKVNQHIAVGKCIPKSSEGYPLAKGREYIPRNVYQLPSDED